MLHQLILFSSMLPLVFANETSSLEATITSSRKAKTESPRGPLNNELMCCSVSDALDILHDVS